MAKIWREKQPNLIGSLSHEPSGVNKHAARGKALQPFVGKMELQNGGFSIAMLV